MRLISLCDGIGSAHIAAASAGWTSVASSEIDPECEEVVSRHFPDVESLGDMSADGFIEKVIALAPDVIMSSTPCQAFSTIGKRNSLSDGRGNLTMAMVDVFHGSSAKWLVWENVLGVLSTKDNAFGSLIAGIVGAQAPVPSPDRTWPSTGCAAGPLGRMAWRVLDSQGYVPQKRRRLFMVATKDGRDPVEALFEDADNAPQPQDVKRWSEFAEADMPIAFDWQAAGPGKDKSFNGGSRRWVARKPGLAGTLNTSRVDAVLIDGNVRKFTPRECARLMGYPENYLEMVTRKGKAISDTRVYEMYGNSIVVPLLEWLFKRVQAAEASFQSALRNGS